MAASQAEPAVAATAAQLGIDLYKWEPRTAKYWQQMVCPYGQEVAEVVQGLLEAAQEDQLELNQGEYSDAVQLNECHIGYFIAEEVFTALSTELQRGLVLWILTTCKQISCTASESECSPEVCAALGKQRRFAAYCLSASALQVHFRRSPVPAVVKSIIEEAFGASETGFQGKRSRQ